MNCLRFRPMVLKLSVGRFVRNTNSRSRYRGLR
jgi:hypothetical protein